MRRLPLLRRVVLSTAWLACLPAAFAAADVRTWLPALERDRVLRLATHALAVEPVSIRALAPPPSAAQDGAQPGDFVSQGDYWWPDPAKPDGLPYVRRDGQSNPANFTAHRAVMMSLKNHVAALAAASVITGEARFAARATDWLRTFFIDPATRMNPHLRFAQGIPGITAGRGIGIIDTLHLAEVARATERLRGAPGADGATIAGVEAWFAEYLHWMRTHPNGLEEAAAENNHSVAYWLQIAAFARLVGDEARLAEARAAFWDVLLPRQLAADGSFPRELARTKPYGYSIFQLDIMTLLADLVATPARDPWRTTLADGRSVTRAVEFLEPYLARRDSWPHRKDVEYFEDWPVRQIALLLAGVRLERPATLALWRSLPADSKVGEVQRNLVATQPVLWVE
jgi:hypothetical protein